MGLIAVVAVTGPLVRLPGTVRSIMGSFSVIGMSNAASPAMVARVTAEALLATSLGLIAAIPAAGM